MRLYGLAWARGIGEESAPGADGAAGATHAPDNFRAIRHFQGVLTVQLLYEKVHVAFIIYLVLYMLPECALTDSFTLARKCNTSRSPLAARARINVQSRYAFQQRL